MKKFSKVAVVLLMLVASFFALAACNKVEWVSIDKNDMPRVTYVQGQELDLSGGELTVKDSEGTKKIGLDTKGVSVKGYDKDLLGEQTLTISYEGKKTELEVTVIPRVAVENYEKSYFVGDEFNKGKGRLKVAKDDGSVYSIQMNDAAVSIEGFDSSSEVNGLKVTARYNNGVVDYAGTFEVNIYEIANVAFDTNNTFKTEYKSHDAGFVPNGGYFTISANELSKTVDLTADMVEGFDLTKATKENSPLTQELTIEYLNKSFKKEITIVYTDVSEIKKNAASLASLNWSGETAPAITKTQGELAYATAQLYFGLSDADKKLISDEEKLSVMRAATEYGYNEWKADIDQYSDVFVISATGVMQLNSDSTYEDTKEAVTALQDTSTPVYTWGAILRKISSEFSTKVLVGETKIGDRIAGVYNPEGFPVALSQLGYMCTLYEKLESIEEWTADTLVNHKAAMDSAIEYIQENNYKTLGVRYLYDMVSKWRANDDYFEILYTYYYTTNNTDVINVIDDLHLPGKLEDLYQAIFGAINSAGYSDSLIYMINYFNAYDLVLEIMNGSDEMCKSLYKTASIDNLFVNSSTNEALSVSLNYILYYAETLSGNGGYGYYFRSGMMLGDAEYDKLVEKFVSIGNKSNMVDGYEESVAYGEDMQALFNAFVALSPVKQYGFLAAMNLNYRSGGFDALDFSDDGKEKTTFALKLADYYTANLSDDGDKLFADLLLAMEYYAARFYSDNEADSIDMFISKMDAVNSAYGKMSDADQGLIDVYFGDVIAVYNRYATKYANYPEVETTDLGSYQDEFDAIASALSNVAVAYNSITQNYAVFTPFFTAYEEAEVLVKNLLATAKAAGDTAIIDAYYNQDYTFESGEAIPLDFLLYTYRDLYIGLLTNTSIGEYLTGSAVYLYEYYNQEGLQAFMADASYLIWTNVSSSDEVEVNFSDTERGFRAINAFRELEEFDRYFFYVLDAQSGGYYYSAVDQFLAEVFGSTDEAPTAGYKAAKKLIEVEEAYLIYLNDTDGKIDGTNTTYLQDLKDKMAAAETLYSDLLSDTAGLTIFVTYLQEMYDYYAGIVAALE